MSLNNSQYNAIMRIYNQRQFQDKYEQDQRREEVYQKVPQIRQIEDEISSQAVRCARKLLDGDTNAKEELKQHIEDLREQKEVLLSAFGFPADYMEMHYACPECQDTGYVDGRKCRCFKKEEIRLLYSQSNIEEVLLRENFDSFSYEYYDDRVVIPEQEYAQRLARTLNSHNVLDYIELSEDFGILDVPAPAAWQGKTLRELNIRAKLGVNIIAVENNSKTNVSPAADYAIQSGDTLVVLGDNVSLEKVQKL